MAKRTRKKRKISPIKKTLRKRNLARNFIVLLSLIFILLLFAYFFLSKNNQAVNSSSNNNILQSQKLYTNDEIMKIYGWIYKESSGKHRYCYLRGNKKENKIMYEYIKDKIKPYPKLNNT